MIEIKTDLEKRKRTDVQLRESEELFRAVADNIPQLAWMTDADGKILWFNRRWSEYTGRTLDEMQKEGWGSVHHPEHSDKITAGWRRALSTGGLWEDIFPLRDKEGQYRWFLSRAFPIRDREGKVTRWFGTNTDITEQREAEERLRAQYAVATILNQASSVSEAAPKLLKTICETVGWQIGALWQVTGPDELVCVEVWHTASIDAREFVSYSRQHAFAWNVGLPGRVRALDRPLWIPDLTEQLEWQFPRAPLAAKEGLRAAFGLPVRLGNEIVAVLEFLGSEARPLDHELIRVLEAAAAHIGQFIERQRAEASVRELLKREGNLRQTLELAMQAGRIGTFEWDVTKNRHSWSKETEKFFGYSPGSFPGTIKAFLNRVHPEDRQVLKETIQEVLKTRKTEFVHQFRVRRPDGSVSWLSARGRAGYDDCGKANKWVGVLVDVTALKESEHALTEAKNQMSEHAANLERTVAERTAKLTETVHELEAFSYSLSHDMRAPLRAMKGFSQILKADFGQQLSPEGIGLLERISNAAGRLDQLIQDVLTYSKVVRERIRLEAVSLEHITRQLIDENPALQRPNAEIEIVKPLQAVLGHEAYLTQVLSNLVSNAVKFVPKRTTPRVRIWTEPRNGNVRVYIKDNGIGIPKEAHERIFGMFQRLHSEQDYEGTGIGLAIVRKAAERMGGRVGLHSEPGSGSTFWIELRKPVA